nr:hypothetical protein FFPRI1PSEUD_31370 [Pseudomonas sp. FFPRI_1]
MLESGRRYLEDGATLAELNGRVRATLEAGHFWGAAAPLMEVARDWEHMINRAWDEMGEQPAPLTEVQFNEWYGSNSTFLPVIASYQQAKERCTALPLSNAPLKTSAALSPTTPAHPPPRDSRTYAVPDWKS